MKRLVKINHFVANYASVIASYRPAVIVFVTLSDVTVEFKALLAI